jgi:DNA polymerase epsilon subunit 1
MSEFLGDELVEGKGLNCSFIIANKPFEMPIADRVIPLQIFEVEESIKNKFLKKWLKESNI